MLIKKELQKINSLLRKNPSKIAKIYQNETDVITSQLDKIQQFLLQKKEFTSIEVSDISQRSDEILKKIKKIFNRLSVELIF